MGRLTKSVLVVLWSSIVGFGVGAAVGSCLCPFTFGISLVAGTCLGTIAGAAAGLLAVADRDRRREGWGLGIGAAASVLVFVALMTDGFTKPDVSSGPAVSPVAGMFAFGVGSLCGRIAERVARRLAESL